MAHSVSSNTIEDDEAVRARIAYITDKAVRAKIAYITDKLKNDMETTRAVNLAINALVKLNATRPETALNAAETAFIKAVDLLTTQTPKRCFACGCDSGTQSELCELATSAGVHECTCHNRETPADRIFRTEIAPLLGL